MKSLKVAYYLSTVFKLSRSSYQTSYWYIGEINKVCCVFKTPQGATVINPLSPGMLQDFCKESEVECEEDLEDG